MSYEWTDNPADPCAYDVQWMTADERTDFDPYEEEALPFIAPGVFAERVYRFVHDACEKAAIQYTSESRD